MSYAVDGEGSQLICAVKGHVPCYCSCEADSHCCGCDQIRTGKIYLHCLACGADISYYVDAPNEFPRCPVRPDYEKVRDEYSDKIREVMYQKVTGRHLTKSVEVNL